MTALPPTSVASSPPAIIASAPTWLRANAQSPSYAAGQQLGKNFMREAGQYTAQLAAPNAKLFLRKDIHGVPVIPSNLKGKALQEYVGHTLMQEQESSAKTLVFISLDMPTELLRRWFATAWRDEAMRKSVVFVVRGWPSDPTGLPQTVQKINSLMLAPTKAANVEVNPTQFESHHITRVPVILHKAANGIWGGVIGDAYGLRGAIARIDKGKGNPPRTDGATWPIAEPDLVQVMEQRIRHYDFAAAAKKAQAAYWGKMASDALNLPESDKTLNYLWNPSVVATQTLRLPNGEVLVKAGQEVNPLKTPLPWTQSYILFDPRHQWQVKAAQQWTAIYRNVVLMATAMPSTEAGYASMVKYMGQPVYQANDWVAGRLGVHAVPALVRVSGDRLSVVVPRAPIGGK